jgi:nucleotide-binding universal stress UspA family protein
MKTILVPTDFSKAAGNAAEYAIHLAKDINAQVLLYHVYHVPVPASGEVAVMIITPEELQKDSEKQLKKEAARLKKKTGVDVKYKAKMGLAVDAILEEENASFIIMGMRGASKLSEALMGSITTDTLRKANTPVIVIPENASYKRPAKIALACDYNPLNNSHTLDLLKDLLSTFGSILLVVNIKRKKDEEVKLQEAVAGVKLENELDNVEHYYFFPEKEDLVEGINEFIENHKADMVAVIPHHYNLVERLFHKSISKKMAFHTQVPLLVLPENNKSAKSN